MAEIKENISLKNYSNYKIGGPARYFLEARNADDIRKGIEWAKNKKQKHFILAGGTNILFDDNGFDGLIIKIEIKNLNLIGHEINAGAGIPMKDLVNFAAENSLSGLEWAGGLPGTLGGAVRGNAGAFGHEIKDNLKTVRYFNVEKLTEFICKREDCRFGYRSSFFKDQKENLIILAATLSLKPGDREEIKHLTSEKIEYRKRRHPLQYPNVGSIFKNVDVRNIPKKELEIFKEKIKNDPFPVVPAAVIIARTGLPGLRIGDAQISEKHTNFIVNVKSATAQDVKKIIEKVKVEVYKKFGIKLEEEVQIL